MKPQLTLTREIRFALEAQEVAVDRPNGFAGQPALVGIAPFLQLSASIAGEIDAANGMLINIKFVDRVLREHAVPLLRELHFRRKFSSSVVLLGLFSELEPKFSPHTLTALHLAPSPFLSFYVRDKERPMIRLTQRFEFSAAHRLHSEALSPAQNVEVFGRCNNANGHGHNYEIEVTVKGDPGATGAVVPIPLLQKIVNEQIIDRYDHKHLNLDCSDFAGLNPTVENIAKVLYRWLAPHISAPARLESLRVWETPKTMAEYSE